MKWVHPEIDRVFDTESRMAQTLVVENRPFYAGLLSDIHQQMSGFSGKSILSQNDTPVDISKNADILEQYIPFDINRKTLLTKMISALEKIAVSPERTLQTGHILQQVQDYLDGLAFEFPCDIIFPKLSIGGIIKSAGAELREDYPSISEAVIDYMELVRTFDRDRLFFTVNMRSFVADEEMTQFMSTFLSHNYHVIMLECHAYTLLPLESRTIIDEDLCEI